MSDAPKSSEAAGWARQRLGDAVSKLVESGLLHGQLIEAKPAWALHHSIVIGKVREQGENQEFLWVICGDTPLDTIRSSLAANPRDAARHFAMKWQLEAERKRDPAVRKKLDPDSRHDWDSFCDTLVARAEALSELVADDAVWVRPGVASARVQDSRSGRRAE